MALTRIHGVFGLYAWQLHSGKALRWNPLAWPHSQSLFFGECPRSKVVAPSRAGVS